MFTDQGPLGEPVFVSADVARLAGISLRQLQWWDERKLVSPRQEGHRRVYVTEQVLEILTVAVLRLKGVSLQKIRRILRLWRRWLGHQGSNVRPAKRTPDTAHASPARSSPSHGFLEGSAGPGVLNA